MVEEKIRDNQSFGTLGITLPLEIGTMFANLNRS